MKKVLLSLASTSASPSSRMSILVRFRNRQGACLALSFARRPLSFISTDESFIQNFATLVHHNKRLIKNVSRKTIIISGAAEKKLSSFEHVHKSFVPMAYEHEQVMNNNAFIMDFYFESFPRPDKVHSAKCGCPRKWSRTNWLLQNTSQGKSARSVTQPNRHLPTRTAPNEKSLGIFHLPFDYDSTCTHSPHSFISEMTSLPVNACSGIVTATRLRGSWMEGTWNKMRKNAEIQFRVFLPQPH